MAFSQPRKLTLTHVSDFTSFYVHFFLYVRWWGMSLFCDILLYTQTPQNWPRTVASRAGSQKMLISPQRGAVGWWSLWGRRAHSQNNQPIGDMLLFPHWGN